VMDERSSGERVAWRKSGRVWETGRGMAASTAELQESNNSNLREGSQE